MVIRENCSYTTIHIFFSAESTLYEFHLKVFTFLPVHIFLKSHFDLETFFRNDIDKFIPLVPAITWYT